MFRFTLPRCGVTVERRQFPLRPCYAITVNKSQGQTLKKVYFDVRASIRTRTAVLREQPCQKPKGHLDADAAKPRARRTRSDKERGLQRTATIVDRLGSGTSQTEDVCSPDVRLSCRYIYLLFSCYCYI